MKEWGFNGHQSSSTCLTVFGHFIYDVPESQTRPIGVPGFWSILIWFSLGFNAHMQEIQWETRAKVEVGEWLPNCLHHTEILSEQCLNWRNNSLSPSYIVVTHWISNRGLIDSILLILDGPTLDVSTMVTCPKWTMSLPSHDVGHNAHRFYQFYSAKCTNRGRYKYD